MTPAERALRDAWIAEMWSPVPEVSREERAVDAARKACAQIVHKAAEKTPGKVA